MSLFCDFLAKVFTVHQSLTFRSLIFFQTFLTWRNGGKIYRLWQCQGNQSNMFALVEPDLRTNFQHMLFLWLNLKTVNFSYEGRIMDCSFVCFITQTDGYHFTFFCIHLELYKVQCLVLIQCRELLSHAALMIQFNFLDITIKYFQLTRARKLLHDIAHVIQA